MVAVEDVIASFKNIQGEEDLRAFVNRFNLEADRNKHQGNVSGVYLGKVGETVVVRVTHRWYDRSKPFSYQPDGNKVLLEMQGMAPIEVGFLDDA